MPERTPQPNYRPRARPSKQMAQGNEIAASERWPEGRDDRFVCFALHSGWISQLRKAKDSTELLQFETGSMLQRLLVGIVTQNRCRRVARFRSDPSLPTGIRRKVQRERLRYLPLYIKKGSRQSRDWHRHCSRPGNTSVFGPFIRLQR